MKWSQSRTLWVIALTAVIGAWQAIESFFSPELFVLVNSVLLALAAYFRIDARVK